MADYTYLQNVPACRIHKTNAEMVKEECEDMLKRYRERLLILASSTPTQIDEGDGPTPWIDFIQSEFNTIWEEMFDESHRLFLANYILENPEECEDELE